MNVRYKGLSYTLITVILAVVLMVVGLTACDEIVSVLNPLNAPDLPGIDINIPVGVVVPLSREYPLASGQSAVNGFALARKEINSLQPVNEDVTFIIVDDMATLEGTLYTTVARFRYGTCQLYSTKG